MGTARYFYENMLNSEQYKMRLYLILDQLNKIYHKMEIQLNTYSQKKFMGLIRTKSKKKSLYVKIA